MQVVISAHPGARQNRVELQADGSLAVWVRARPVDGQANAAIERALAHALGLRPRQVVIVTGHTARRKIVAIEGLSETQLRQRLDAGSGGVA